MTNTKHIKASLALKLLSLIGSVYGMTRTIRTLQSFTYFTNLSNIFLDVILMIFIIKDFQLLKDAKTEKSNRIYTIKFMATISITLTFLVYMFLLAPTQPGGIMDAYFSNGAGSFGVHFFGPLLAIIDFLLFDYGFVSKKAHSLFAIIPPIAYVGFVFILSAFGMRWGDSQMHAPYNFLNYGAETGWLGFDLSTLGSTSLGVGVVYMIVVLALLFLLIGSLFLFIKNLRRKKFLG